MYAFGHSRRVSLVLGPVDSVMAFGAFRPIRCILSAPYPVTVRWPCPLGGSVSQYPKSASDIQGNCSKGVRVPLYNTHDLYYSYVGAQQVPRELGTKSLCMSKSCIVWVKVCETPRVKRGSQQLVSELKVGYWMSLLGPILGKRL